MMKPVERRMGATGLEFRDSDADGITLTGYASTFNEPYDMGWYTESVHPNAFQRTLGRNPDVRFLINHDGLPLARTASGTLHLDTDSRGLRVRAQLDPSDPDVARIVPKMRRGDLNEMSFAFRVDGQDGDEWSNDMSKRSLLSLDINNGDVSTVTYPANPGATSGLRSLGGVTLESVQSALRTLERRAASEEDVVSVLTRALGYFSAVDSIVDAAQVEVADALGVPNPDVEQDAGRAADTDVETRAGVSDAPWDGSESRFTPEQWRASCVLHKGDSDNKSDHGFPIREPDGTLNRNAVHAAAARINQAKATPEQIAAAKSALRSAYKTLGEDAPDSVRSNAQAVAELEERMRIWRTL